MVTRLLTTIDIAMPDDFPIAPFEAIHARIVSHQTITRKAQKAVLEYFGAENGIAYRFKACCEYSDHFATVRSSTAENVHIQEKDLFGFFVSGLSVLECFCYGAFMVGALIEPPRFKIATAKKLQNIKPGSTAKAFKSNKLTGEPITTCLRDLLNDSTFSEWKDVRNALAHRQVPGRLVYPLGPHSIWKVAGGIPLDPRIVRDRRAWLANVLATLLAALEGVAVKYL